MMVLEQFEQLPILVFTCRYNEMFINNAGARSVADTKTFDRRTGSLLYPLSTASRHSSGTPQFQSLQVDHRAGTITLSGGQQGAVQHYVDDGRALLSTGP
jgi:hypothetical protein